MRITSRTTVRTGLAALIAAAALAATSTGASAATGADGFPILSASAGNVAHTCHILGTDDDYHEAIVCVDINTMTYDGEAFAQSEVEAYCQTTGGTVVQCANIIAEGEIATGGSFGTQSYNKDCGHQYGACPTGRETLAGGWVAVSAEGDGSCGQVLDSNAQLWSFAVGGLTEIELPGSGDSYTLSNTDPNDGTNESTGHYFVCY